MTDQTQGHVEARRRPDKLEERTFFVLVPELGKPGAWIAVYADGSYGPATAAELSQAAAA
jgi:hypothetical protein